MDPSVKPGDDFFAYANGKWAARTEIPSDKTRYGNFDKLSVLSESRVHAIVEDAVSGKLNRQGRSARSPRLTPPS